MKHMVFSSSVFLFGFLPVTMLLYFVIPSLRWKNILLLAASLIFYAWGEPVYVTLMVASIILNYCFARFIARTKDTLTESSRSTKTFLICAIAANLAILGFFKYEGFLADNINACFGTTVVPNLELALPIGISFFTLQALSYIVDVYRGTCNVQTNVLYLGMYIAMFPQLVAGPIVRYTHIENQIRKRSITLEGFVQGLRLFVIGLGKKALLANTAGTLATALFAQDAYEIGFFGCASAVIAYTFQIYFDFSGYSDMAIGLGRMFGFTYQRNFNYPYISTSVTEFWRRWHISLSSFFRDYVYIPLGGSRVPRGRWLLNLMIVWGLTGIWHGAAWNFLLWGLYYGMLLIIEKLFLGTILKLLPRFVQHLYVIASFLIGWTLFSITDFGQLSEWIAGLCGTYGFAGLQRIWEIQSWQYASLIPIFIIACTPIVPWCRIKLERWIEESEGSAVDAAPVKGNEDVPPCMLIACSPASPAKARIAIAISILVDVALIIVLLLSCAAIVSGSYNPFIYFRF